MGSEVLAQYQLGLRENFFQEHLFQNHLELVGCRPYGGEILHVTERIFSPDLSVHVHDHLNQKCEVFDRWHITNDTTLVGVDKNTLQPELKSRGQMGVGQDEIKDWDNHSIELVTRTLPCQEASLEEVERYLLRLRGSPESGHLAFITDLCGLHVHVGRDPETQPSAFTLSTLKHLAYMTVMYEKHISSLHPPRRRPDDDENARLDLRSNRDLFLDFITYGDDVSMSTEEEDGDEDMEGGIKLHDVRSRIFSAQDIPTLATVMGQGVRDRIINWTYVGRSAKWARTLEFRQHEGTLDVEAVTWWVRFVIGLVRLADHQGRHYGADAEYDGDGYYYSKDSEKLNVFDLFEMMDFPTAGREYFRGRIERFESERLLNTNPKEEGRASFLG